MRVFLDTNVLASAVATRGLCSDVLREVLTTHELIISDLLLMELNKVLRHKFRVPSALIEDFICILKQDTILAEPVDLSDIKLKDKNDLTRLSSAISAKAKLLVTGDKELLSLVKIKNVKIVSPRQFWEKLKK